MMATTDNDNATSIYVPENNATPIYVPENNATLQLSDEDDSEDIETSHLRYFSQIDPETGARLGRYSGYTAEQAASKAFTQTWLQKNKDTDNEIIYLRESISNGSPKIYAHQCSRVKLDDV